MARTADPDLPARIVAAADALWRQGGQGAVTIRDVARRAKTTTPSVYAHFKDRDDILRAVRKLARARFEAALAPARGVSDGNRRLLDFAEANPRDYELLFGHGFRQRASADSLALELSGFEAHVRAAGVPAGRARRTALAIVTLLHGAIMFRLAHDQAGAIWREFRATALEGCETLLRQEMTAGKGRR